jgi:hypothetical protein
VAKENDVPERGLYDFIDVSYFAWSVLFFEFNFLDRWNILYAYRSESVYDENGLDSKGCHACGCQRVVKLEGLQGIGNFYTTSRQANLMLCSLASKIVWLHASCHPTWLHIRRTHSQTSW